MKRILPFLFIFPALSIWTAGCGGHTGGGTNAFHNAGVRIYWPPITRVIPDNADYVIVTAYSQDQTTGALSLIPGVAPVRVSRPVTGVTWTYTALTGLPETSSQTEISVIAGAYSNSDSVHPLATGEVDNLTIGPPAYSFTASVTLDSTIDHFKVTVNGTSYDLSTNPTVHLSIGSTSFVTFQAVDSGGNTILLPASDLSISASGNVLAEDSQSAVLRKESVTIVGKHESGDLGLVTISDAQQILFAAATLTVAFDAVAPKVLGTNTVEGPVVAPINPLNDIATRNSTGSFSELDGVFETNLESSPNTSYTASADFRVAFPSFSDLGYAWPSSWGAPTAGNGRLAAGGVSSNGVAHTGLYACLVGTNKIDQLDSGGSATGISGSWGNVADIDSEPGTDLYALFLKTSGTKSFTVARIDSSLSASSQFSLTPRGAISTTVPVNIAVTFLPVTPIANTRPATAVYMAYNYSSYGVIVRYVQTSGGWSYDTGFSYIDSSAQILDISADGPLLYVLDATGAGNLSLTALSWDGTELSTSPVSFSGLSAIDDSSGNPISSAQLLRVVARSGAVYVAFSGTDTPSSPGTPFTVYGAAVAQ